MPDPRAQQYPGGRARARCDGRDAGWGAGRPQPRSLTDLRDVRTQTRALAEKAKSAPVAARDAALQSLIAHTDSLEALVVNGSRPGGQGALDVMDISPKLNTDVSGLLSVVEGRSGPVTSGEREQLARLTKRASAFHAGAESAMTAELARVNTLVASSGLTPALARKRSP